MDCVVSFLSDLISWILNFLGKTEIQASLVTGVLALIAARWAYRAATRQIRIEETKQHNRKVAYQNHILSLLKDIEKDIFEIRQWWEDPRFSKERMTSVPYVSVHDDMKSSHWEDHAMLPENAVQYMHQLYRATLAFKNSLQEIESKSLSENDALDTLYVEYEERRTTFTHRTVSALFSDHLDTIQKLIKLVKGEIEASHLDFKKLK